jgi:hypothetical protein
MDIPEFSNGISEDILNAKAMSFSERITSKSWKVRKVCSINYFHCFLKDVYDDIIKDINQINTDEFQNQICFFSFFQKYKDF